MISYIIFVILVSSFIQFGCSITLTSHNPANVRLQDGADSCEGLVQFYDPVSSTLLQACNAGAGDNEVKVICRQLGCDTANAKKVDSVRFGYAGADYFTFFNYSCSGNELDLSLCNSLGSVNCTTSDFQSAVAADCDGVTQNVGSGINDTSASLISKAFIIIICSIVGGLLLIVAIIDTIVIIYCAYKRRRGAGLDLYIY